ncbi:MAG: fibronectin type III domain-containing protein [Bacteroidales bacterium]|jgi:hypothetical protein
MDSTRIKIGQVLYGQKEGSEDVALVKVESVGVGGINYNDTDNSFQYSFDELFGIPVAANVLLSSGFTLSNGLYVNDNISFIKIKQINGQWFWYADKDKCIMVKYLHELQGLYGDLTGNTLAVDEDALLIALDSPMVLSAPEGFATSAMTPNTVTITWDEDADAEGYSYQIDDGDWVEVLEAVAELTGLTYSTPYKIRVKAIGDGEDFVDSPESEEFSFTTDPLIVLDAPADLTATEVGENDVTVTWSAVANASEYEVAVGETTDTVAAETLTYQFTTLDVNTEYTFSVKAVGDGITYDDSLESEVTETTLKEQLGAPVVAGETLSTTSVKFSWVAIANAGSYSYSTDDGVNWESTELLEITLTELTPGTSYTMSVKAIAAAESNYRDSDAGEGTVSTNSE